MKVILELLRGAGSPTASEPWTISECWQLMKMSLRSRRAHSEVRTMVEGRKWDSNEDGLLRRLKLLYFNSPEYTREELRASYSD
ncbi:unnamed protein product [Strongylus vulgaris]|uniref:Uncharacterized protein n=1 Tax=Strongylus vulgaris TaxID=40348 RepID=A0A3P7IWR9_STRVU|nr:unnamed protein product [Strongylus vulgaris]